MAENGKKYCIFNVYTFSATLAELGGKHSILLILRHLFFSRRMAENDGDKHFDIWPIGNIYKSQ